MKFFLIAATTCFCLTACNDKAEPTPESAPNTTNVQNVNGNQPDTTSGIELDSRQSGDTTKIRDTTRR